MRAELAAALRAVGVAAPDHASAEGLVKAACLKMTREHQTLLAYDRKDTARRVQVRQALVRAGRDQGLHASLDDMIAELVAVADGRLMR